MRTKILIGAAVATAFVGVVLARSGLQSPALRDVDEKILREYTGAYSWGSSGFVYLQLWNEFSGFDKPGQLVAFDESGDVRVLYPTGDDQFFAGPGAAGAMAGVATHPPRPHAGMTTASAIRRGPSRRGRAKAQCTYALRRFSATRSPPVLSKNRCFGVILAP